MHLSHPIQILMPPFLEASAAKTGGVDRNFSHGIGESLLLITSRVTCNILVSIEKGNSSQYLVRAWYMVREASVSLLGRITGSSTCKEEFSLQL